jgi:hypothetical protein
MTMLTPTLDAAAAALQGPLFSGGLPPVPPQQLPPAGPLPTTAPAMPGTGGAPAGSAPFQVTPPQLTQQQGLQGLASPAGAALPTTFGQGRWPAGPPGGAQG